MSSFYTILLIAISLSMDAFSLSLAYGMIGINKKETIILSLIVGIFHYIMPLIGLSIGFIIDTISFINLNILASIILIYIGIDLIVSNPKEDKLIISIIGFIIFALSVSIDSLTVGISLKALTNNYLLTCSTFAITSLIFTYIGLIIGNIIGKRVGIYSKIIGGIILIVIAIIIYLR